jgi:hypothetical protein
MTVLDGRGSERDDVSRLKGVEPLRLVQSTRGREAEECKPIAHDLAGQALVNRPTRGQTTSDGQSVSSPLEGRRYPPLPDNPLPLTSYALFAGC